MAEYYIDKDSGEEKEKRSVVLSHRVDIAGITVHPDVPAARCFSSVSAPCG